MRGAFNWIIGLIAAAVLTGGAVSLAATAMPASDATGSSASLQAQLNDLNARRAALDAQLAQRGAISPTTSVGAQRPSTPTTTSGGQRTAAPASSRNTTPSTSVPSTVPPTTTPSTTPSTTPTTTPSGGGSHEGSDDHGSSGAHEGGEDD